jgi:phosphoserine phosphatase
VQETYRHLHQCGLKTAVVSGGFIAQARRAQQAWQIIHAYAAVDLLWDPEGFLVHWNLFPSDYAGKVDFVRLLMREYGLPREACGFVGDGRNGVLIAQEVGLSFAYQAHPELCLVATHVIDEFSQLLPWMA